MPALTNRTRWLMGGGVAVVAIAIVAGGLLLLGGRPVPEALRYVPGDSVVVAEVRLDLPGDQLSKLGNLLSHFPGFRDQSTLATKLDQSLDQLLGDATNGSLDYSTKLKPWLAGAAFVGVGPAATLGAEASPAASDATATPALPNDLADSDAVIVATTDGSASCAQVIPTAGTSETYQGLSITESSDGRMACALDGRYAMLGTVERVKAAIDAHRNGTGIDHDSSYATARDALGQDRLATLYVSGRAVTSVVPEASAALALPGGLASLPAWAIAGLRAEDGALVADLVVAPGSASPGSASASPGAASPSGSPPPTLVSAPPPHVSQVADAIPGNAVALVETHGVGAALQNALTLLEADPAFQSAGAQLAPALQVAGGPAGVIGWIDDAAVVVLPKATDAAGAGPAGAVDVGVVLVATDEATAASKAGQLKSLLSLAALSNGGSAEDTQVDGVTVTTVDFGDLSTFLGQAGLGSDLGGVTIPTDLHATISLAVRGKLVLIGGDDAFARSVLDADAGNTLADQAAYKNALGLAASANQAEVYVSGDQARALVDALLPADEQSQWQTDLRPYADPIDSILITSTTDGGLSRTRLVIGVVSPSTTPGPS